MPITSEHLEYTTHKAEWALCRALVDGENAVKYASETFLPRLSEQSDADYRGYKSRAVLLGAFARTVDSLCGMIERKPPEVELAPSIVTLADDIDGAGTRLDDFANNLMREMLTTGSGGVLTEYSSGVQTGSTIADVEQAGIRPYAVFYPVESIIDWRTGQINGHIGLTMVKLRETWLVDDPNDIWAQKKIIKYRVLTLESGYYEQVLYMPKSGDGTGLTKEWIEESRIRPLIRGVAFTEIPFDLISGINERRPPMLDLATLNLAHYRNSADFENGLHFSGVPTAIFIGEFAMTGPDGAPVTKVALGSSGGIQMQHGGDAKYLEYSGSGIEGGLGVAMKDKVDDMAKLGARMMEQNKKLVEAAQTAAMHRQYENSMLAAIANKISRFIQKMLERIGAYYGDTTKSVYWLNTDYVPVGMSAQDITAMVSAWQAGAISMPELLQSFKDGEIIRSDKSLEDHLQELSEDSAQVGLLAKAKIALIQQNNLQAQPDGSL